MKISRPKPHRSSNAKKGDPAEPSFRDLANAIPNLAWMADADGFIYWYNNRWYEYTGTTAEEMKGWGWKSVHDPAVLDSVMEKWTASIATGEPFEMVFPLRAHDGSFRSFLTRIVPVRNRAGEVIRWFGTNTDIDELRKAQLALLESESKLRVQQERLRLLRASAKIASWEYDVETEQFAWSEDVHELFEGTGLGTSQSEFLSRLKYSADRENAVRALKGASGRKRDYQFDFRLVRSDGRVRVITARGTSFFNGGRNIVLGMFIDITPTEDDEQHTSLVTPIRKRKTR